MSSAATATNVTVNNSTPTATAITAVDVKFHEDTVPAFVGNDGEVYAPANQVLRNIGFDEDRVGNIRKKWRDDEVISTKGRNFTLSYSNSVGTYSHETYCLSHKILPLALAKISITPTLKKEYPEVVKKLISYQTECADVLYKHFFNKTDVKETSLDISNGLIPLTNEACVRIGRYFLNYQNDKDEKDREMQRIFAENLITAVDKKFEGMMSIVDKKLEVYEKMHDDIMQAYKETRTGNSNLVNALESMKKTNVYFQNSYESNVKNQSDLLNYIKESNENNTKVGAQMESISKALWATFNFNKSNQSSVLKESIAPKNKYLVNMKSEEFAHKVREEIEHVAAVIGAHSKKGTSAILGELYSLIENDASVDMGELLKEYRSFYHQQGSKIKIVSESDILRNYVQSGFNQLFRKYYPHLYMNDSQGDSSIKEVINQNDNFIVTKDQISNRTNVTATASTPVKKEYLSQLMMKTPLEVKNLVQKVADRKGEPYKKTVTIVFKEIENRTNKNLKELSSKYAEKMGYTRCSKAYYISKSKMLMEVLKNISEGN